MTNSKSNTGFSEQRCQIFLRNSVRYYESDNFEMGLTRAIGFHELEMGGETFQAQKK